jgi:mediator of RNA polymerase II transcription subunit 5
MLVLLLQHQFDVDMNETGISYPNSFILKYARVGHQPRYPELSDAERKNLSGWIKGLYDEGSISDDLMSSCTPKDFHLFVATLFQQSLAACEHGILGLDTLKGGFECKYNLGRT